MSRKPKRIPPGVEVRHRRSCPAFKEGGECACTPNYRAIVRTPGSGKIQRTFKTVSAAKQWRDDALVDLKRGTAAPNRTLLVRTAAEEWVSKAQSGTIRNRSGDRYKPSALRGYEQALRDYIVPALGTVRLAELQRGAVQHVVDQLLASELSASTVRNALLPLRAICRRALLVGEIHVNPTHGLELPAVRGRRDRVASPTEARALLAVLPEEDRAIWATALYAGLRLGELRALRVKDLLFDQGVIQVRRGWDAREGVVLPKSAAGVRDIPMLSALREHLHEGGLGNDEELAFGRGTDRPFSPTGIGDRADRLWTTAGQRRITLHECRHTFATLAIAAGVNVKALQTFMGHSSITVTLDRYGHLFPGSMAEAGSLLDAYLESAD